MPKTFPPQSKTSAQPRRLDPQSSRRLGFTAASLLLNIASKERIALAEVTFSLAAGQTEYSHLGTFHKVPSLVSTHRRDPLQNKPPDKEVKRVSPTCLL
jgi:hypothetical protein